jgi:hypothetical protein
MFAMRLSYHCGIASAKILHFERPGGGAAHRREQGLERQTELRERLVGELLGRLMTAGIQHEHARQRPTSMAWPFQRGDLSQE